MRKLFNLILKQYFFLLFLVLEILSFFFIFSSGFHRTKFLNAANFATASVKNTANEVTFSFSLNKANQTLVYENAVLREKLMLNKPDSIHPESGFTDTNYRVIPAKVISNSINKKKNYILLNQGSKNGVKHDMGVISSDGVVGIIVNVSYNYCNVMSLLHIDNKINARIKKNNHLANMAWPGSDYTTGLLEDIPGHVDLHKGDSVITSGNSFVFPGGILIGIVEKYEDRQDLNFNTAMVKYSVDFNNLFFVYIISNENRNEQIDVSNLNEDE